MSKYEIEIKDGDHAIRIANAMIRFGSELTDSIAFNSKNSVLLISRGSGKTAAMRVAAFVPAAVEGAKALLELVELKTGASGEYPRGVDHGNIFSLIGFLEKAVPNLVQVGMKVPE